MQRHPNLIIGNTTLSQLAGQMILPMEEVVFRRYRRPIDEKKALPQLIVIDGGKGQLSSL